jgi:very-short-patch-repair endonuclease
MWLESESFFQIHKSYLFKDIPFRIRGSSMPKKHRMLVLCGQIMLMWLALLMFFVYFTVRLVIPIFANPSMITGFVFLTMAMLLETVAYEETPLRQINLSEEKSNSATVNNQNEPTSQAKKLHEALKERGIYNELEPFDGYKHVDISIPWAKLDLEVDGEYHRTISDQWFSDLKRDLYSHNKGKSTIHIPNHYVDTHLDELANVIAEVIRKKK